MTTLIKGARFRFNAMPEEMECSAARNLNKTQ